jgi:hypothetical protein
MTPNQELQLTAVACISWSSLFLSAKIMEGKISLCWNTSTMKTYGGVEVKLHTLLNYALKMNGDDQRNDSASLSPEKGVRLGGCVGPTAGVHINPWSCKEAIESRTSSPLPSELLRLIFLGCS